MMTSELKQGEKIIDFGTPCDYVFFVLNGRASFHIENGQYGGMDDIIQPGSVLGTIEATRKEVAIGTVTVLSSTLKLAKWPRAEFMELVASNHRLQHNFNKLLAFHLMQYYRREVFSRSLLTHFQAIANAPISVAEDLWPFVHAGSMVNVEPNFILSLSNVAILIRGELQHCAKFHEENHAGHHGNRFASAAKKLTNRERFLKTLQDEHHDRMHKQFLDSIEEHDTTDTLPHNGLPHITYQSKLPSIIEQSSINVRADHARHKAQAAQISSALLPPLPTQDDLPDVPITVAEEELELEEEAEGLDEFRPDSQPKIVGIAGVGRGHYVPLTPCLLFVIGHTNVKVGRMRRA